MSPSSSHITKTINSSVNIDAKAELIWEKITNVQIEEFSDPLVFKILGIPRPLKADLVSEGIGGKRIAYFSTGKRFIQEITKWEPHIEYSFNFNPEKGFVVGYFFDISEGIFRVPNGSYFLKENDNKISLQLITSYSLDKRFLFLLNLPVRFVLKSFQKYLLKSIKKNCE